ncbi:MAG: twin-arginine translocase TatA/TatE family subunit [Candidatus Thermoplasmatota archaeon]|jgi:sec-independent protein translocase protein TatA|nr:twin-arginine translocase TatA/TatE family subunit [Candidatus Thermoplasmatota archaeon]MCL5793680.1 twin-arginine translocase TatA/TatE family subunit [Candidatus Thermoplasmatota archaeon]
MFDSPTDWLIIIVVVLVLFGGAKKIPEFARSLGKATGEFSRGKMEIEKEIRTAAAAPAAAAASQPSVREAARNLGIETTNKTDDELKIEMSEKLKS